MYVKSRTNVINGETAGVSIPNSTFQISANIESENESSNGGTLVDYSPILLVYAADPNPGTLLLSGDFVGNGVEDLEIILTVTYDCGTLLLNNLLNQVPDYYFLDIEFTLTSIWP